MTYYYFYFQSMEEKSPVCLSIQIWQNKIVTYLALSSKLCHPAFGPHAVSLDLWSHPSLSSYLPRLCPFWWPQAFCCSIPISTSLDLPCFKSFRTFKASFTPSTLLEEVWFIHYFFLKIHQKASEGCGWELRPYIENSRLYSYSWVPLDNWYDISGLLVPHLYTGVVVSVPWKISLRIKN